LKSLIKEMINFVSPLEWIICDRS